jgi:hypothetical protein
MAFAARGDAAIAPANAAAAVTPWKVWLGDGAAAGRNPPGWAANERIAEVMACASSFGTAPVEAT